MEEEIKSTDRKCVVCGGDIVELIIREYDPRTGPLIVGPGSVGQFKEVSKGFHCEACGLVYQFLPHHQSPESPQKKRKRRGHQGKLGLKVLTGPEYDTMIERTARIVETWPNWKRGEGSPD